MGPKGFIINLARGAIIEQGVLVDSLAQRRIAGTALDALVDEPRVPAEPLGVDTVLLSPAGQPH